MNNKSNSIHREREREREKKTKHKNRSLAVVIVVVVDDQCCRVKESTRSYSLFASIKASASVHTHIFVSGSIFELSSTLFSYSCSLTHLSSFEKNNCSNLIRAFDNLLNFNIMF